MNKALNLIRLMRLHNVAAAVLSTAVGYSMTGSGGWPLSLIAAVAVSTAAGYTINDLYDIDIDRINKPRRPIPSGAVSVKATWMLYVVLLVLLVLPLVNLHWTQSLWIVVWVVLLHLYSAYLKRIFLAGNLIVSAVSSSGFLLGAFTGGRISSGVIPAVFTFMFMLGRELVKDCEDIEGDLACGARTIPIVKGKRYTLIAAVVIFAALALCFPLPYFLDLYAGSYVLIMMFTVVPVLVVSIALAIRESSLGIVSAILKLGMFFGIVAFYFGASG